LFASVGPTGIPPLDEALELVRAVAAVFSAPAAVETEQDEPGPPTRDVDGEDIIKRLEDPELDAPESIVEREAAPTATVQTRPPVVAGKPFVTKRPGTRPKKTAARVTTPY